MQELTFVKYKLILEMIKKQKKIIKITLRKNLRGLHESTNV